MKSYTHFTLWEREYLQENLEKGKSLRKIAKALGRSPSTISREVKRNWSKKPIVTTIGTHKQITNIAEKIATERTIYC